MRTYTMSFGASLTHTPKHPERTARRAAGTPPWWGDTEYREWTNRAAMARTIRMQQKAGSQDQWTPCVPLREGEGF